MKLFVNAVVTRVLVFADLVKVLAWFHDPRALGTLETVRMVVLFVEQHLLLTRTNLLAATVTRLALQLRVALDAKRIVVLAPIERFAARKRFFALEAAEQRARLD